jgi:hypothetical protein
VGGTFVPVPRSRATVAADSRAGADGGDMHSVIYVIGLIVVVLLILSFLGLR